MDLGLTCSPAGIAGSIFKRTDHGDQDFVNLPVKDLDRSVAFFTKLGFKFNAQFTDETATCMIVSDDIFVMLLTHAKFKLHAQPNLRCFEDTEVWYACRRRAGSVNATVRKAVAAGDKLQRAAGPWLHVWAWIPGSGWPHLGARLHGAQRSRQG